MDPRVAARLRAIDEQAKQAVHEREVEEARKLAIYLRVGQTAILLVVTLMLFADPR